MPADTRGKWSVGALKPVRSPVTCRSPAARRVARVKKATVNDLTAILTVPVRGCTMLTEKGTGPTPGEPSVTPPDKAGMPVVGAVKAIDRAPEAVVALATRPCEKCAPERRPPQRSCASANRRAPALEPISPSAKPSSPSSREDAVGNFRTVAGPGPRGFTAGRAPGLSSRSFGIPLTLQSQGDPMATRWR
jgi:hypothetical protein